MLQRVNPGHKSLADYRSIIRRELYDEAVGDVQVPAEEVPRGEERS